MESAGGHSWATAAPHGIAAAIGEATPVDHGIVGHASQCICIDATARGRALDILYSMRNNHVGRVSRTVGTREHATVTRSGPSNLAFTFSPWKVSGWIPVLRCHWFGLVLYKLSIRPRSHLDSCAGRIWNSPNSDSTADEGAKHDHHDANHVLPTVGSSNCSFSLAI